MVQRSKIRILITLMALAFAGCAQDMTPERIQVERTATQPIARATEKPTATPQAKVTVTPTAIVSTLGADVDSLQGLQITFWHVWSWEPGQVLRSLVDDFNRRNPYGIEAEAIDQGGYADLAERLERAGLTGDLPDLIVGFSNQLDSWDATGNFIVDLNAYIEDPLWGYADEEREDFYPVFWNQDVVDGKRLGLPAQRSGQFLYYNQTWASELGFEDPPATLEEFERQACAAAQANSNDEDDGNNGTGGWVVNTSTASALGWIQAFGGDIFTEGKYTFDQQATVDAFLFLKALFDNGCAYRSINRFPDPDFATRKALFITSSTMGIPFQEEAFEEAENDDEWAVIPYPSNVDQNQIGFTGPSFAIVETSPERQLATWLLIKWLLEPENQANWIRVSGHWPSRASAFKNLQTYIVRHPQWAQPRTMLPGSWTEPNAASWGNVRWALSDAAEQIFRLNLSDEQIPALVKELDLTAAELQAQSR